MNLALNLDRRIVGLAIVAGFATIALAAQSAAVRPAAASPPVAMVKSIGSAAEQVAMRADPPSATATSDCDTQHWPYYSSACLHGEGGVEAPRQIHLQPISEPEIKPTPVAVAPVDTVGRGAYEPRPGLQAPRRRKARRASRYATRHMIRARQIQPESSGPTQALAFSW